MTALSEKLVLFVEDDDLDIELTRRAFEHYGFDARIETAPDGQAALDRLRAGPLPDLVLTDIKMPRVSGLELQERMRREPGLSAIPVIVLTSSAERGDKERAEAAGARAFLQKPMELKQFEGVVAALKDALGEGD